VSRKGWGCQKRRRRLAPCSAFQRRSSLSCTKPTFGSPRTPGKRRVLWVRSESAGELRLFGSPPLSRTLREAERRGEAMQGKARAKGKKAGCVVAHRPSLSLTASLHAPPHLCPLLLPPRFPVLSDLLFASFAPFRRTEKGRKRDSLLCNLGLLSAANVCLGSNCSCHDEQLHNSDRADL